MAVFKLLFELENWLSLIKNNMWASYRCNEIAS